MIRMKLLNQAWLHDTSWTFSSWTTEIGRVQPVLEEPGKLTVQEKSWYPVDARAVRAQIESEITQHIRNCIHFLEMSLKIWQRPHAESDGHELMTASIVEAVGKNRPAFPKQAHPGVHYSAAGE